MDRTMNCSPPVGATPPCTGCRPTASTPASPPMRSTLQGVRLMLAISWRADRIRSVGAAVTASGQYVVLPLRALGLKMITDGIVAGDRSTALTGAAVMVGASAA